MTTIKIKYVDGKEESLHDEEGTETMDTIMRFAEYMNENFKSLELPRVVSITVSGDAIACFPGMKSRTIMFDAFNTSIASN